LPRSNLDFSGGLHKTCAVNLSISELSARQLRQAANLKERIDTLQRDLNQILGSSSLGAITRGDNARAKRTMSAATKAKLAAIARARWKKAKAQGKSAL
jgi:hypothetical protein